MDQQPSVESLKVGLVQPLVVILREALEEGLKRLGHGDAYLVTAVIHSLQELHVHCVEAVGVKGRSAKGKDSLDDTAGDEAGRAAAVFQEGC